MASVNVTGPGSNVGTALASLLMADDIEPGAAPSYELCKTIYSYHPLGGKMVDGPIEAAQSQPRELAVPGAPDEVVDAFAKQWLADGCDENAANVGRLARIYGIASLALIEVDVDPKEPIDFKKLWNAKIGYNALDPLNTAGSLVLNQDPNSPDFQKHAAIAVAGKPYARNRSVTLMNERPLYVEYTASAFGFVGRSVYQRPLLPLKSFVQTMITDDMVSKKAGLLIAFIKGAGSFVDNLMAKFASLKRSLLKVAVVDNVLSMGPDDRVESLNLQNLDGAFGNSRTNILKNIATAAKMPAVMLENETLTEGFGEGTEDAKVIAQYVDGVRTWLAPVYAFLDAATMRRAWNPDFIKLMRAKYPDVAKLGDDEAIFLEWRSKFSALWPSLLKEPESEQIKVEDVKFRALLATASTLAPGLDPENRATVYAWVAENLNQHKLLFNTPLELDLDLLLAWNEDAAEAAKESREQGAEGGSKAAGVSMRLDSVRADRTRASLAHYEAAVARLPLREIARNVADRKVG